MLQTFEGNRVPAVTFRTRKGSDWVNITTDELFSGRNVVVFSLPGAFTPTCSSAHVPRFNQLADRFKALGIDEIVCISVNDGFVMNAWQAEQNAFNLRFVPDGNGEFTEKMGMLVDKDDLGFGKRSWRYSMLVRDGIVEKMFIESEEPGDPFNVSDADTMLTYLAPDAPKPFDVAVFSRDGCPHCVRAKSRLHDAGIDFEELVLNRDYTDQTLRAISRNTTYPQIFANGQLIGGAEDLDAWLDARKAA